MPERKNILLISYFFPPLGLGGVGRPYGLYRYLPEFGYDVSVVTVKNIIYPEYDHSLLSGFETSNIYRTGSLDPSRLLHKFGMRKQPEILGRTSKASYLYYPDSKRGWNFFAYNKAKEILNNGNFSAVITTSPPPSAHLVGLRLKSNFGVKWISDFRDLWFSLPIELLYKSGLQRQYARRLKKKIIGNADQIISVNNCIRNYLGRGEVITNGADPEAGKHWLRGDEIKTDVLTIGILGTISDLCPVEPLFKSVASLIDENNIDPQKISILHVGHYDSRAMTDLISRYNLRGIVKLKGYLPKKEAIKQLSESDILYFTVKGFGEYTILPGRIFDYLISGKPIIATVPHNSDAAELISHNNCGMAVAHDDIQGIKSFILKSLDEKLRTGQVDCPEMRGKEDFTAINMAKKYARMLDRII